MNPLDQMILSAVTCLKCGAKYGACSCWEAKQEEKSRMTNEEFAVHLETVGEDGREFYDWVKSTGKDPQKLVGEDEMMGLAFEYDNYQKQQR